VRRRKGGRRRRKKKKTEYYYIKFKYCARFFCILLYYDWYNGKNVDAVCPKCKLKNQLF
jgi:hypothetical protein